MFALNIDCSPTADALEADVLNITNVPTGFDFQVLKPLEMVTSQFAGVSFGCAIALIPSNPRFVARVGERIIMPTGNDNRLSIALDDDVDSFCLWGRCTQPMVLKVLESGGKVLQIHSDKAFRWPNSSETALLPLQILKLENMSNIAMIELFADAPFTIEGLSV
ncbi:hypothetical protein D0962_36350 [Leptolyngbyaceae cyanobacterium CCMR0082]|uniref:Uncharacterized protein n=2 Tax=Adonisia turfae TaxID=2950184 RepID=A0A6M0SJQ8_9CYAN|nr:hypothetical protein [Adonisia turfae]MDV3353151.1 hypothetical protein [Leptothoe sp. LEGE 181152]NEZ59787.1 hypothetical protein [Adonisia turfae CCMR0081]NEZ68143.1 hypothetical protein [Adonisia turfae CCMR0082]